VLRGGDAPLLALLLGAEWSASFGAVAAAFGYIVHGSQLPHCNKPCEGICLLSTAYITVFWISRIVRFTRLDDLFH
jgi:hypothetical protein